MFIPTTNVLIKKDGKYLLIRRSPNASQFPNYLMAPGGKQEIGESIYETAIREFKEETGISIIKPRLRIIASHNHYDEKVFVVYIFSAEFLSGEQKDSSEGSLEWLSIDEIAMEKNLWPDLKIYIPIVDKDNSEITYSFLRYDQNYNIVDQKIVNPNLQNYY